MTCLVNLLKDGRKLGWIQYMQRMMKSHKTGRRMSECPREELDSTHKKRKGSIFWSKIDLENCQAGRLTEEKTNKRVCERTNTTPLRGNNVENKLTFRKDVQ